MDRERRRPRPLRDRRGRTAGTGPAYAGDGPGYGHDTTPSDRGARYRLPRSHGRSHHRTRVGHDPGGRRRRVVTGRRADRLHRRLDESGPDGVTIAFTVNTLPPEYNDFLN